MDGGTAVALGRSAPDRSSTPAPAADRRSRSPLSCNKGLAVLINAEATCRAVSEGNDCQTSAADPETTGAAKLVPLTSRKPLEANRTPSSL